MGICLSCEYAEKLESDENIVYVVEEGGLNSDEDGARRIASLYSQQGKKGPNQDTAILCQGYGMEEGVLCGVFDGHGRSGHVVSRMVRDYLPSLLLSERNAILLASEGYMYSDSDDTSSINDDDSPVSSPDMFDEWKEACINAFRAMDKELKHQNNFDCTFSGTTAVSIIKQGKDLIIANLGDSRAIMGAISEDGHLEAIQLTTDLKPNLPKEAERIRKSNGRIFALRDEPNIQRVWLPDENYPGLAMARSFGDFQLKHYGVISVPEVSYRRLTNRDQFIILASDGVWDVLSNKEVVSIVWSVGSKEKASKAVVEAAVRAWKCKYPSSRIDDCSAACLFLQDTSTVNKC
ncbi:probable protein phosphatase 2C 12 [Typha latifolia]|uniref:probable protein phosphatase 2C 12 n=1 Tax=Typha latifolia TaxID=4733 RepID=UPI003C2E10CD